VKTAFEILGNHPNVKTILVNIFGGILSCSTIAEGIVKAASMVELKCPLVVRLNGNNADVGKKILMDWGKK